MGGAEAGTGESRLIAQLLARLDADGRLCPASRCTSARCRSGRASAGALGRRRSCGNQRRRCAAAGRGLYSPIWTSSVQGPQELAVALDGFILFVTWKAPPVAVVAVSALGRAAFALLWVLETGGQGFSGTRPRLEEDMSDRDIGLIRPRPWAA
jgi:hypothetical protein